MILHMMQSEMDSNIDKFHMVASINSALNLADETIMELLTSITPLIQGKLTHNLLDPLQAQSLIAETQKLADRFNLQVVINQPVDILQCSVTTFATEETWYAMLSIPLVHHSETMNAFQFINIPWFYKNMSVQWDLQPGIVASKSGLYPDIKNVFIPLTDLDQLCDKFNNNFLCHKRINHFPTCQISLFYHHTKECSLKLADHRVRYSFGPFNYLFFQSPTDTLVECPGKEFIENYYGLLNFDRISRCKITTKKFTLLPKSTATGLSNFINKTSAVSVLESEWLKVTVKFDSNKLKKEQEKDPSNPWNRMDIAPDNEEDEVRLFGNHTILVHSIAMFFVMTLIMIMLVICIMNYLDYVPEPFRSFPTKFGSSQQSVVADFVATPAE